MKSKLIAVYFSATMSVFNINAMNLEELAAKQQDLVADRTAIVGVRSLADFTNLPDHRVKRLNSNFVAEARSAHKKLTALSETQTLADFAALDTSWLQPSLVRAIKRADIKLNFNLPVSLYKNIAGIPQDNTIGTQIMTIMKEGSGRPVLNDDVSKALEILYSTISKNPHIATNIIVQVDTENHYWFFQNIIFFPSLCNRTTKTYLKFLSGILVAGRKAQNDFSNIAAEVMPEFLDTLKHMIGCATDEDLGI